MKFDELIEKLLNNEDYAACGLSVDDVITLIEDLKQEYAPTVEMTQEQKEYYASRTLLSGMVFNQNTQYYTDDVHNIDRKIASAILHPETIKVVDD